MILVVDIQASLEYWRRLFPADCAAGKPALLPDTQLAGKLCDIQKLAPEWVTSNDFLAEDGKLHVMVAESTQHRHRKCLTTHTRSELARRCCFREVSPDAFVMTPEAIFLCAATMLNQPQLVALGDELCGNYTFDQKAHQGIRQRSVPLLRKEQLERFVESSCGLPGWTRSHTALHYVIEHSASPMETLDEMLLCLPYHRGGYGLPVPTMNHEVSLSERAACIARRSICYADLCWPRIKLDVEHHGRLHHSSSRDAVSDRARVNGLKEMGFEVIELTFEQVKDPLAFEFIAQRIAKLLGKRIRNEYLGNTEARKALRDSLIAWNRSSGRVSYPHRKRSG